MSEMDLNSTENPDAVPRKLESQVNLLGVLEDEKERTIANAALSVAELGRSFRLMCDVSLISFSGVTGWTRASGVFR
jgi:hypothetical protein